MGIEDATLSGLKHDGVLEIPEQSRRWNRLSLCRGHGAYLVGIEDATISGLKHAPVPWQGKANLKKLKTRLSGLKRRHVRELIRPMRVGN